MSSLRRHDSFFDDFDRQFRSLERGLFGGHDRFFDNAFESLARDGRLAAPTDPNVRTYVYTSHTTVDGNGPARTEAREYISDGQRAQVRQRRAVGDHYAEITADSAQDGWTRNLNGVQSYDQFEDLWRRFEPSVSYHDHTYDRARPAEIEDHSRDSESHHNWRSHRHH